MKLALTGEASARISDHKHRTFRATMRRDHGHPRRTARPWYRSIRACGSPARSSPARGSPPDRSPARSASCSRARRSFRSSTAPAGTSPAVGRRADRRGTACSSARRPRRRAARRAPPRSCCCELTARLFGAGAVAGRGEARRAVRALCSTLWRHSLAPVPPDEAVAADPGGRALPLASPTSRRPAARSPASWLARRRRATVGRRARAPSARACSPAAGLAAELRALLAGPEARSLWERAERGGDAAGAGGGGTLAGRAGGLGAPAAGEPRRSGSSGPRPAALGRFEAALDGSPARAPRRPARSPPAASSTSGSSGPRGPPCAGWRRRRWRRPSWSRWRRSPPASTPTSGKPGRSGFWIRRALAETAGDPRAALRARLAAAGAAWDRRRPRGHGAPPRRARPARSTIRTSPGAGTSCGRSRPRRRRARRRGGRPSALCGAGRPPPADPAPGGRAVERPRARPAPGVGDLAGAERAFLHAGAAGGRLRRPAQDDPRPLQPGRDPRAPRATRPGCARSSPVGEPRTAVPATCAASPRTSSCGRASSWPSAGRTPPSPSAARPCATSSASGSPTGGPELAAARRPRPRLARPARGGGRASWRTCRPTRLSELEPEERPAVLAHGRRPAAARRAAAEPPGTPLRGGCGRRSSPAEPPTARDWEALAILEPYRAARLVFDVDLVVAGRGAGRPGGAEADRDAPPEVPAADRPSPRTGPGSLAPIRRTPGDPDALAWLLRSGLAAGRRPSATVARRRPAGALLARPDSRARRPCRRSPPTAGRRPGGGEPGAARGPRSPGPAGARRPAGARSWARAAPARSSRPAVSTARSRRAGAAVRRRQLRRALRDADPLRALRPRARRLHRRRPRAHRGLRDRSRRHRLPGRDRRPSRRGAGHAAARAAGGGDAAAGRERDAAGRRAGARRHPSRPRRDGRAGELPARSLLSFAGRQRRAAAAARARRRRPAPRRATSSRRLRGTARRRPRRARRGRACSPTPGPATCASSRTCSPSPPRSPAAAAIEPEHLELAGRRGGAAPADGSYHQQIETFRRRPDRGAIAASDGNQAEAARRLGISRQTLLLSRAPARAGARNGAEGPEAPRGRRRGWRASVRRGGSRPSRSISSNAAGWWESTSSTATSSSAAS